MKIINHQRKSRQGFTLIEMIGVLAVIAILASMLIPKIFESINSSRISNTSGTYNTVKTALADHYAKFGSIVSSNGTSVLPVPMNNYDDVLVTEGFLDKPFAVKIGDGSVANDVKLAIALTTTATPTATDAAYDLDGDGTNDARPGSVVCYALISGVVASDAYDLSKRLDGDVMSIATGADLKGRVKYADPATTGGATDVYVYITHR